MLARPRAELEGATQHPIPLSGLQGPEGRWEDLKSCSKLEAGSGLNPNGSILPSSEHFLESPNCWNTQLRGTWEYEELTNTLFTELSPHTELKGRAHGLLSWVLLSVDGSFPSLLLRQIRHCPKPFFSSPLGLFSWLLLGCEREGATCHHWLLCVS